MISDLLSNLGPLKFLNIGLGKFAFFGILAIIIIYLIKPKPKNKMIPSLMFLAQKKNKGKINSFLRKIVNDPLFLIQLLAIIFLAIAALEPVYTYKYDMSTEKTVIVLDTSASMSADDRFDDAKDIAKEKAVGLVTLIGVENNPKIHFIDYDTKTAKNEISSLKVTASTSNILAAMKLADKTLGNSTGKIIVISDFVDTENEFSDISNYKNSLEGKGRNIEFVVLPGLDNNIGFIGSEFKNNVLTLKVKNYNDEIQTVTIKNSDNELPLTIQKNSIEKVQIELDQGLNEVTIKENDDFDMDNKFYINVPSKRELSVLVITNEKSGFLFDFLESSKMVSYDVSNPPKIPNLDSDVVILYNIDDQFMLAKIVDDLKIYVSSGGGLIIYKDTGEIEKKVSEFMPVDITGTKDYGVVDYVSSSSVVTDLSFGEINNYFTTNLKTGAESLVSIKSDSVISYINYGNGRVLYYGIPEEDNDFKVSTSYPIFFNRALQFVSQFNDFDDLNRKSIESGFGDKVGFVEIGKKTYAVNLLDEKESDIILSSAENEQIKRMSKVESETTFVDKDFDINLILLSIILLILIFEIYFIKRRGDI